MNFEFFIIVFSSNFVSFQDTVMGLKAISAYGAIQPALNLRVDVKSTKDASFRKNFYITKRNALVQESIEVQLVCLFCLLTATLTTTKATATTTTIIQSLYCFFCSSLLITSASFRLFLISFEAIKL